MSSKFDPLTAFLLSKAPVSLTLSFEQIESLVGPLKPSARTYAVYWKPSPTHVITHAWLRAGYIATDISMSSGTVKLRHAPHAAMTTLKNVTSKNR